MAWALLAIVPAALAVYVMQRRGARVRARLAQRTRQLEEREQRFVAIFDYAYQFIGLLSPDGEVLEANQTSLRLIDADPADVIGRPLWETPWWQHSEARQQQLKTAIAQAAEGHFVRFDTTHPALDGSLRQVDFSLKPIVDATGRVTMIIPEGRDVTEQRAAESRMQQGQKMEALGRLSGGIAHDFNNLLTVISANTELLQKNPDGPTPPELVKQIADASRSAAALTRQLMAFGRKGAVRARDIEIDELLRQLAEMARRVLPENIRTRLEIAPDLWPVRFDDSQLQQIVLNLALNARDAMPEGGTLRIEARNVERPHPDHPEQALPWVQVDVSDSGHGMTDEQTRHVFEPFFTTKQEGTGTGLGLAMVYGALQQHRGFASVDSRVGSGSTFSIFLPRASGAPERTTPMPSRHSSDKAPRRARIYVVEDEQAVRRVVVRVLQAAGFDVEAFPTPEAIASVVEDLAAPDLLLTDLVMPGMSGYDLSQRLTESWPGLPVLYMSGYSDDPRVARVVAEGAPFLAKPFRPGALIATVEQALRDRVSLAPPGDNAKLA